VRTSVVIAAYNEEETLAEVLQALQNHPQIDEIIVVSDGSTDRTVEIAREFDVRTVALRENRGKGYAMRVGVEHASGDILFFVDGDMLNISRAHIDALLLPVLQHECDMNVGVRHRGAFADFFHLKIHFGPVLSGIRAMRREVFEAVPPRYMRRFMIETALNYFCARERYRQRNTVIRGLGHVTKEKKRGRMSGLGGRLAMIAQVVLVILDMYLLQGWRWLEPLRVKQPETEYELID
jgi:polyisoprenyl-phosphate glycosyltransferase